MSALIALIFSAATPDAAFEPAGRPLTSRIEVRVTAVVLRAGTSQPEAGEGDLRRQVRRGPGQRPTIEFE